MVFAHIMNSCNNGEGKQSISIGQNISPVNYKVSASIYRFPQFSRGGGLKFETTRWNIKDKFNLNTLLSSLFSKLNQLLMVKMFYLTLLSINHRKSNLKQCASQKSIVLNPQAHYMGTT